MKEESAITRNESIEQRGEMEIHKGRKHEEKVENEKLQNNFENQNGSFRNN